MAGKPDFPYTTVPGSLKRLLEKIPTIGVPDKADANWLAALGMSGGNNAMNLPLMKQVGILDSTGKPTGLYKALRAKDKAAFAAGIKSAYAALFSMYPDAHRQDDEALMAFARSRTDYAERVQRLAVRTFKVFTEFGDFETAPAGNGTSDGESAARGDTQRRRREGSTADSAEPKAIGLTVNIQLQLPPSADGEVYDKLFAAMAKHLKGLISPG